jgi:predicted phage terminase large subunit-like protein
MHHAKLNRAHPMEMLVRPLGIYRQQQEFLESQAWIRGFCGGRGTGKTVVGSMAVADEARRGEPWLCVAPDNNMAREVVLPVVEQTLKSTNQYIRHVISPAPKVWFHAIGGGVANLTIRGAEKPDKLLGRSVAGLWLEEASTIPQVVFEKTIPVCRFRGRMGRVLCTFTPRGFAHWSFNAFYEEITWEEALQLPAGSWKLFRDRPYRPKKRSQLVTASTKDNWFLSEDFYDAIKDNYSTALSMQELGGEFIELQGTMFSLKNFQVVSSAPRQCQRVRYWDKASTDSDGCFSAGVLLAKDGDGIIYVESVVRGQWSALTRNRIIKETCAADELMYGGEVITYIEQEGAGSGKDVNEEIIRQLGEYTVFSDPASASAKVKVGGVLLPGDAKVRRAMRFSGQVAANNVRIVEGPWNRDFTEELCAFPHYVYCDQVDAVSAGYLKLAKSIPDNVTSQRETMAADVRKFGQMAVVSDSTSTAALLGALPWR